MTRRSTARCCDVLASLRALTSVRLTLQGETGGPGQKGSKGDKGEAVSITFNQQGVEETVAALP